MRTKLKHIRMPITEFGALRQKFASKTQKKTAARRED